ncbi:hypothetical protein IZU99_01230 [Oscillospiraceae bacterium CM]|nr:hypothetical protein IZU99_01230 [Oscillospiraceae bacterium CM]
MLLFVLVIAAIVYFIVKPGCYHGYAPSDANDAEVILKKRFVSGEIDEETYKKMLQTLRS